MNKTITLEFKKTYISLSGNPYGQEIYETQIRNEISGSEHVELVFPEEIENIGSSFFQGLFKSELEEIGKDAVKKKYSLSFENKYLNYDMEEALSAC